MRPAVAARLLRRALSELDAVPGSETADTVRGGILVTLAITEAELGDAAHGLALLDQARPLVTGPQRAVVHAQRAVLLRRIGRDADALPEYDAALRLLDERESALLVAKVLLNRGVLHTAAGRLAQARSDLQRCLELATADGAVALVAKAEHDLGFVEWAAGDLPAALRRYERTEAQYREVLPGNLAMLSLDRARVLLVAGLYAEAEAELARAVPALRRQRSGQDHAEGLLAQAEAALLAGRAGDAGRCARRAAAAFER
ncbi:tetratricopeptide repeat protein, partial [Microbacterium sp.]|uniref:tetratricopeptide repeat protein n=1 Tax=Microbacterium sp. TaxID=51671 RepID=UPI0039E3BC89